MTDDKVKIQLTDFGTETVRQKRTITGGILMEVVSSDCGSKDNRLADKL